MSDIMNLRAIIKGKIYWLQRFPSRWTFVDNISVVHGNTQTFQFIHTYDLTYDEWIVNLVFASGSMTPVEARSATEYNGRGSTPEETYADMLKKSAIELEELGY